MPYLQNRYSNLPRVHSVGFGKVSRVIIITCFILNAEHNCYKMVADKFASFLRNVKSCYAQEMDSLRIFGFELTFEIFKKNMFYVRNRNN